MNATLTTYMAETDGQWHRYLRDPLPPTDDPGWALGWGLPAWRDEFDGPTIDTDLWTIRDDTYLSYDWGNIHAENAEIVAGELRLRISQLGVPVTTGDGRERWWDTAYLDTIGKLEERYGRWEMRAKIPTTAGDSQGVWPAFWLRNGDSGEIDIMESWGDPPKRPRNANLTETSTFTIHESTSGGGAKAAWTYEHTVLGAPPYDTASGYHTWTVELTPTYLRAYFDGLLAVEVTPTTHPWVWGTTFDSPWNIRLNTQMGDPYWTTNPTPSALTVAPADYLIDYVRYWALPA